MKKLIMTAAITVAMACSAGASNFKVGDVYSCTNDFGERHELRVGQSAIKYGGLTFRDTMMGYYKNPFINKGIILDRKTGQATMAFRPLKCVQTNAKKIQTVKKVKKVKSTPKYSIDRYSFKSSENGVEGFTFAVFESDDGQNILFETDGPLNLKPGKAYNVKYRVVYGYGEPTRYYVGVVK